MANRTLSLLDIVLERQDRFYLPGGIRNVWWYNEKFARLKVENPGMPLKWYTGSDWAFADGRVTAADLAAEYVKNPLDPRFRSFLWADQADQFDNQIYVGGIGRYGIDKFQIHRHLENPGCVFPVASL